jgi:hypothetical protein
MTPDAMTPDAMTPDIYPERAPCNDARRNDARHNDARPCARHRQYRAWLITQKTQPPILANQGLGNYWMAHRPSLPQGNLAVPSALECFTTRFGMGRGGTTPLRARQWFRVVE